MSVNGRKDGQPGIAAHARACALLLRAVHVSSLERSVRRNYVADLWKRIAEATLSEGELRWRPRFASRMLLHLAVRLGMSAGQSMQANSTNLGNVQKLCYYLTSPGGSEYVVGATGSDPAGGSDPSTFLSRHAARHIEIMFKHESDEQEQLLGALLTGLCEVQEALTESAAAEQQAVSASGASGT